MQLQVRFIMRNENILKIKETFFFVFTVHCVSLTPTLNLHRSFYKCAFHLFLHACRLNPWLPGSFSACQVNVGIREQTSVAPDPRDCGVGGLQTQAMLFAETCVLLPS